MFCGSEPNSTTHARLKKLNSRAKTLIDTLREKFASKLASAPAKDVRAPPETADKSTSVDPALAAGGAPSTLVCTHCGSRFRSGRETTTSSNDASSDSGGGGSGGGNDAGADVGAVGGALDNAVSEGQPKHPASPSAIDSDGGEADDPNAAGRPRHGDDNEMFQAPSSDDDRALNSPAGRPTALRSRHVVPETQLQTQVDSPGQGGTGSDQLGDQLIADMAAATQPEPQPAPRAAASSAVGACLPASPPGARKVVDAPPVAQTGCAQLSTQMRADMAAETQPPTQPTQPTQATPPTQPTPPSQAPTQPPPPSQAPTQPETQLQPLPDSAAVPMLPDNDGVASQHGQSPGSAGVPASQAMMNAGSDVDDMDASRDTSVPPPEIYQEIPSWHPSSLPVGDRSSHGGDPSARSKPANQPPGKPPLAPTSQLPSMLPPAPRRPPPVHGDDDAQSAARQHAPRPLPIAPVEDAFGRTSQEIDFASMSLGSVAMGEVEFIAPSSLPPSQAGLQSSPPDPREEPYLASTSQCVNRVLEARRQPLRAPAHPIRAKSPPRGVVLPGEPDSPEQRRQDAAALVKRRAAAAAEAELARKPLRRRSRAGAGVGAGASAGAGGARRRESPSKPAARPARRSKSRSKSRSPVPTARRGVAPRHLQTARARRKRPRIERTAGESPAAESPSPPPRQPHHGEPINPTPDTDNDATAEQLDARQRLLLQRRRRRRAAKQRARERSRERRGHRARSKSKSGNRKRRREEARASRSDDAHSHSSGGEEARASAVKRRRTGRRTRARATSRGAGGGRGGDRDRGRGEGRGEGRGSSSGSGDDAVARAHRRKVRRRLAAPVRTATCALATAASGAAAEAGRPPSAWVTTNAPDPLAFSDDDEPAGVGNVGPARRSRAGAPAPDPAPAPVAASRSKPRARTLSPQPSPAPRAAAAARSTTRRGRVAGTSSRAATEEAHSDVGSQWTTVTTRDRGKAKAKAAVVPLSKPKLVRGVGSRAPSKRAVPSTNRGSILFYAQRGVRNAGTPSASPSRASPAVCAVDTRASANADTGGVAAPRTPPAQVRAVRVIRKKRDREALRAFECDACLDFHHGDVEEARKFCRHRAEFSPARTPPGYWSNQSSFFSQRYSPSGRDRHAFPKPGDPPLPQDARDESLTAWREGLASRRGGNGSGGGGIEATPATAVYGAGKRGRSGAQAQGTDQHAVGGRDGDHGQQEMDMDILEADTLPLSAQGGDVHDSAEY